MLLNIIRQTIIEYNLFDKGDRVLIGLSGGADSICLTYTLNLLRSELGLELFTAHLNHGIRGDEAMRDEQFAQSFSENLGIKCFTERADIPCLAKNSGKSEETIAREVRYAFFERILNKYEIDKIATAHNRNDNAETILMNLIRGGTLSALCGIPYKRGNIVRPLLNVKREQIEKYCKLNQLEFVTDSTNLTDDYTRNKIRHIFIPQIENEFNPNFIETVTSNAVLNQEENNYLKKLADEAYRKTVTDSIIDISALQEYDTAIQRRIVRNALEEHYNTSDGITSQSICDILELAKKNSGKSINIHNNTIVKNEYGKLIITNNLPITEVCFEYRISVGEMQIIDEIKKKIVVSKTNSRKTDGAVYLDPHNAEEITVRSKRTGDKFYPSGMSGSKKLKEYFIDSKIPKDKRSNIPVIEINGKIGAVGRRVDERFLFKDKGIKIEFFDI